MTYNPEPEIKHYLKRLSKAARDLPRVRRRELLTRSSSTFARRSRRRRSRVRRTC